MIWYDGNAHFNATACETAEHESIRQSEICHQHASAVMQWIWAYFEIDSQAANTLQKMVYAVW